MAKKKKPSGSVMSSAGSPAADHGENPKLKRATAAPPTRAPVMSEAGKPRINYPVPTDPVRRMK